MDNITLKANLHQSPYSLTFLSSVVDGNLVSLLDQPGVKGAKGPKEDFSMLQGATATGYNRNSMQSIGTFDHNAYNIHWYNNIYRTVSVNNVSIFNKYIFEKILKINKDTEAELSALFGDSVYNDAMQNYKVLFNSCLATDSLPLIKGVYLTPPTERGQIYFHDIMDLMGEGEAWMENACELYLIGTPEDVEDLSMFPGLIVREVSDETRLFIKDAVSTSILHAKSQLIKYKLETYYDVIPRCARSLKDPTAGLFDGCPYCERADFQDPRLLETISPSYEQQINPDERVYKIYIQMSDDLITTAYERSNFFIDIRNSNKKMSIKNFMKYLS